MSDRDAAKGFPLSAPIEAGTYSKAPTLSWSGSDGDAKITMAPGVLDRVKRQRCINWCERRGIDPFEIVADGGCEAWMAVTDHNLKQEI